MARKIVLEKNKLIFNDDIEEILEGEVKKIGSGGMVLANKRHIGKKTYLLIRKD